MGWFREEWVPKYAPGRVGKADAAAAAGGAKKKGGKAARGAAKTRK